MSALARQPELVRAQRARELEIQIVAARRQLDDIRAQAALIQRRIERALGSSRRRPFWLVAAGVVTLLPLGATATVVLAFVVLVLW